MSRQPPKTFQRFLTVLAIVGTITGCSKGPSGAPTPLQADAALQAAGKALGEQKPDKALRLLAPALAVRPDDPETLNMQGAILTKLKDYDAARACYEKALRQSPGFFPARYNIGALMALRGEWEPATTYFRNMLIDQPNNELVQYKLLLLLLSRDSDPALQKKLFAEETPSNSPGWYYASAARAYKQGNRGQAAKFTEVARSVYGDQTGIFEEELEESGLGSAKK
jgi:tetratricopeptide (TPR) repeat protein